ncbi:MAG: VOC family protein [Acidobacteria bacterium]|nr:VOC family protein [Acidobacteriota bacterium]
MPHSLTSLTPNLIVSNVEQSITFYRDTLGFDVQTTVPDLTPYVFAIITSGDVRIFLNSPEAAVTEYPVLGSRPLGGTLTLFIEVTGIRDLYEQVKARVTIVMPIEVKWYGQTEFAFADPDGYVITLAERK